MIELPKVPSKAKTISEAISKKVEAKKKTGDIDLNGVIETLSKRNIEARKEAKE